jgi:hypothetical protein
MTVIVTGPPFQQHWWFALVILFVVIPLGDFLFSQRRESPSSCLLCLGGTPVETHVQEWAPSPWGHEMHSATSAPLLAIPHQLSTSQIARSLSLLPGSSSLGSRGFSWFIPLLNFY